MVFMGLVGGRGDRVLRGKGAEIGQVQFNDGIADGGDVSLGNGHSGLL